MYRKNNKKLQLFKFSNLLSSTVYTFSLRFLTFNQFVVFRLGKADTYGLVENKTLIFFITP